MPIIFCLIWWPLIPQAQRERHQSCQRGQGDLLRRGLWDVHLDDAKPEHQLLGLDATDLAQLALLDERRHLGGIRHRLLDFLEGVLDVLPLQQPHEPVSGLYPNSWMSSIGSRPLGRPSSSSSSMDSFLHAASPVTTSAPARWLSMAWDAMVYKWELWVAARKRL